jgi:Reverse transcriptase (RNA-dependent DNA polymerase)
MNLSLQMARHNKYGNKRHARFQKSGESQVLNLSSKGLKRIHTRILNKGLQYIPTRDNSDKELCKNMEFERMRRNIRLILQFGMGEKDDTNSSFKFPSSYMPDPSTKFRHVERFLNEFQSDISSQITKLTRHQIVSHENNLTMEEHIALESLAERRDIIIKPSDKGSMIVIMDREKYIAEGMRQLSMTQYYAPLQNSIQGETHALVRNLVFDMLYSRAIDKKLARYLLPPPTMDLLKPHMFYLLPKPNKPMDSWPNPNMPPGRPIVTNVKTEVTHLSQWVDHHLQPYAQKMPNLVQDSYDFIAKLNDILIMPGISVKLIAADVKNLYTNIPHDGAIEAITDCLDSDQEGRPDKPPTALLIRALRIILENNNVEFHGQQFLQTKGIAMGTNAAPAIANIYMGKIDATIRSFNPLGYFRFIDDGFIVWDESRDDLQELITRVNATDPNLELIFTEPMNTNTFLDVEITVTERVKTDGKLDWKVHFKPTDSHQLLHKKSNHPHHTFAGIIKSQIIRYRRLCSRDEDVENACNVLFKVMVKRGYTRRELLEIKSQVERLSLTIKAKGDREPSLYLISQFDKRLRALPTFVRSKWQKFIIGDPTLKLPNIVTTSWKRNKNIGQMVIRAKV